MTAPDFDPTETPESRAPSIDLRGVIARRWRPMLGLVVVGLVASLGVWLVLPPRFYAQATIVVTRQQVSEAVVEPTLREDALSKLDALAAEVLSSRNLVKLVEEFDLYPELRDEETMAEIVDRVRKDVSIVPTQSVNRVARDASALVYSIGVEAGKPEAAAGVANRLASLFVDMSLAERHREHQLTTEFLRRELQKAEQALREQNRQIAEFKKKNRGTLPSELQTNTSRMEMLQNKRQALAVQIAEAGTQIAMLAGERPQSPVNQLDALRAQLRELRSSHTDRHPDVRALEEQIAKLEQDDEGTASEPDLQSPSELVRAAQQTIEVLQRQLEETEREIARLDQRIGGTPEVQEAQASMEERALILRENYLEFLRKVHNSQLSEDLVKAQQGERVSIVNEADPPSQPQNTPWRYLIIGLLSTLAGAAALGFVLEMLDPVLDSAAQIEHVTSVPVLGWAPRIR